MDIISTLKHHAVLLGTVAVGVYFVTPMIQPMISGLPVISSIPFNAQGALLAGGYAVVGSQLNSKYSL